MEYQIDKNPLKCDIPPPVLEKLCGAFAIDMSLPPVLRTRDNELYSGFSALEEQYIL